MFVVMPAEAGIQVLNGIARFARDLKIYLWVADPRQVFSLLVCTAEQKKATQGAGAEPPANSF